MIAVRQAATYFGLLSLMQEEPQEGEAVLRINASFSALTRGVSNSNGPSLLGMRSLFRPEKHNFTLEFFKKKLVRTENSTKTSRKTRPIDHPGEHNAQKLSTVPPT